MERFRPDLIVVSLWRRLTFREFARAAWIILFWQAVTPGMGVVALRIGPLVGAAALVASPVPHVAGSEREASEEDGLQGAEDDEIFLISTRAIGTACRPETMAHGLRCERRIAQQGRAAWQEISWNETLTALDAAVPKIFYVHGNRVARGPDRAHGMMVYARLPQRKTGEPRRQFVIWSWPSEQVRGPLKDYREKAARTHDVGWQLAWVLDQLPSQTRVAISGYSYGASVVTCALHLLAGGALDGRRLPVGRQEDAFAARHARRYDVALVAAAFDADWLASGGPVERAPELIDRLLLVNNRYDPAMRFYHLSTPGRNARALGYAGPLGLAVDPAQPVRLLTLDVTERVGRTHALESYLRSAPQLGAFLADETPRHYNR